MTFLPIVARELRIASRRRSTYWLRSGAALVVLVIAAWFFLVAQNQPPHQISMVLFGLLTGGAGLYCLFSGIRYTADCLSEEKREGTLGLLFLTDLKGYDVVFGKLVANSLSSLYGVLAVVPMLALPLLLGGVTPGEFGRMALVTLNTLFFSLAAGICVSALCRSARHAMGMTLLLILLLAAVLPAFGAWLAFVAQARQVPVAFLVPSPGFSYVLAFDTGLQKSGSERILVVAAPDPWDGLALPGARQRDRPAHLAGPAGGRPAAALEGTLPRLELRQLRRTRHLSPTLAGPERLLLAGVARAT